MIQLLFNNSIILYVCSQYARETDTMLAQQRKDNRQKLFALYPELKVHIYISVVFEGTML